MQYPAGGEIQSRVCAEVDCGALLHNCGVVQRTAKHLYACDTIAVVKADAYGHGAVAVAALLRRHAGVSFFAVATLPEALELRAAGFEPHDTRVVILG